MKITSSEIKSIIPGECKIFDREFVAPADAEMMVAVVDYLLSRPQAEAKNNGEKHDCDNRVLKMWSALSGRGWAVGFVAVRGHAVIGYVNDRRELKFIESLDGVLIDQPLTPIFTMMV